MVSSHGNPQNKMAVVTSNLGTWWPFPKREVAMASNGSNGASITELPAPSSCWTHCPPPAGPCRNRFHGYLYTVCPILWLQSLQVFSSTFLRDSDQFGSIEDQCHMSRHLRWSWSSQWVRWTSWKTWFSTFVILKDSGMRARSTSGEKEKRVIEQLEQVEDVDDE